MTDLVVMPTAIDAVLHRLRSVPSLVAVVGDRVADEMPPEQIAPRWPALRVAVLTTVEVAARRITRSSVQVDCWAETQPDADRLGSLVVAALRESANHRPPGAVMGESTDLAVRSQVDETLTPSQPRSIVTGHVWLRPDP